MLRRVLRKFERTAHVQNLHIGGQLIETTDEHPYWVKGHGWTPAFALRTGDELRLMGLGWLPVDGIADSGRVETVYNLEIEDDHTFFVGCDEWGFSVWVHNSYMSPDLARRARALRTRETNEIVVRNADEALEVFFREFRSGHGTPSYTNTSGWSKAQVDVHGKAGTYHWDTVAGDVESTVLPGQKVLRGHYDDGNPHSYVPHLQIHTHDGQVIRILMDGTAFR